MDYEKAYEDALERAKGIYNENPSSSTAKFVCGQIFPEIKESEDKRIRECLVTIVKVNKRSSFGLECNHGATWDEMLAYLEKQKEQEPINECNTHELTLDEARKLNEAYEKGYSLGYKNERNEQNPAEWSEEDETAYGDLIWCIEQAKKSAKDENDMGNIWFAENWVKNRLKSIRPQPHWKPSEEQMEALKEASTSWMNEHMGNCELLKSLYNDLKSYKS